MTKYSVSLTRRIAAVLIAVILPPLGVCLVNGRSLGFMLNAALAVFANVVFWWVMAAPGLLLWGVCILHALILSVHVPTRLATS